MRPTQISRQNYFLSHLAIIASAIISVVNSYYLSFVVIFFNKKTKYHTVNAYFCVAIAWLFAKQFEFISSSVCLNVGFEFLETTSFFK